MSTQSGGEVSYDGGIRVLDTRAVLFHNAHVKVGTRFKPGCGLCPGQMEADAGVLTVKVPDGGVDKSSRSDPSEPATSAPGAASWDDILGKPGVRGEA